MTDDQVITVEHVAKAGMCVRGLRNWCRVHHLDVHEVMRKGLTVEEARNLHDAFADKVIEVLERESRGEE